MTRDEALRQIAALHTEWSLKYGDSVPYVAEHESPHDGETDLSVHQADRSAPADIDAEFMTAAAEILAQVIT